MTDTKRYILSGLSLFYVVVILFGLYGKSGGEFIFGVVLLVWCVISFLVVFITGSNPWWEKKWGEK